MHNSGYVCGTRHLGEPRCRRFPTVWGPPGGPEPPVQRIIVSNLVLFLNWSARTVRVDGRTTFPARACKNLVPQGVSLHGRIWGHLAYFGLGFEVSELGFEVLGLGFEVSEPGFEVSEPGFEFLGSSGLGANPRKLRGFLYYIAEKLVKYGVSATLLQKYRVCAETT